jgi:hypothetical protein
LSITLCFIVKIPQNSLILLIKNNRFMKKQKLFLILFVALLSCSLTISTVGSITSNSLISMTSGQGPGDCGNGSIYVPELGQLASTPCKYGTIDDFIIVKTIRTCTTQYGGGCTADYCNSPCWAYVPD